MENQGLQFSTYNDVKRLVKLNKLNIGFLDVDLLDKGTTHPNLALMKLSAYTKGLGNKCDLLLDYSNVEKYDVFFISKVFGESTFPEEKFRNKLVSYGGSGFFGEYSPFLINDIEHHKPDYSLYNPYVDYVLENNLKGRRLSEYTDYSIGYTTRGCFRKCDFCINKRYNKVYRHSPVSEFLDTSRQYIYLWDDNILGYSKWHEVFDEIDTTGKKVQFRQGLDIRLLTSEKAKRLNTINYKGEIIFAFDDIAERGLIEKKLKLWRKFSQRRTKFYLLTAYKSIDEKDIIDTFERIKILMKYKCLPYIMRYNNYNQSLYRGIYISLARWCNQPSIFKKKSFTEFFEAHPKTTATYNYFTDFQRNHPGIVKKYFNLKYSSFH